MHLVNCLTREHLGNIVDLRHSLFTVNELKGHFENVTHLNRSCCLLL